MDYSGVGVGAGVGLRSGVNLRENICCKMGWAGPPLEVASCTLGAGSCLGSSVGFYGWRVVFDMGRVRIRVSWARACVVMGTLGVGASRGARSGVGFRLVSSGDLHW